MLGGVNGAVLASGAAEAYHEVGESPIHVPLDGGIHDLIDMLQEGGDLAVLLQELDHRFIQTCEMVITLILTRVVDGSAVEYEAAPIATRVVGDALLVGEAHHLHLQGALREVVGELLQASKLSQ